MDMIINSLYSNRDIFLRELVSNGSDALDKMRFVSLTDKEAMASGQDLSIRIRGYPEERKLIIEYVLNLLNVPLHAALLQLLPL